MPTLLSARRIRSVTGPLCLLVILSGGLWAAPARATTGDGATEDIRLLDTNSNGQIDAIDLHIDNTNTDTWAVNGTPAFAVTQDSASIDISSVTLTSSATANPVIVRIALDETDTDLQVNTDGVTSGVVEVAYVPDGTPATCTDCVSDGDDELNAITADSDADATDTENDYAAPVITELYYSNGDGVARVNAFRLYYSEAVAASSTLSNSNLVMDNVGDFTGLAFGSSVTDLITSTVAAGDYTISTYGTASTAYDTRDDSGNFAFSTTGVFSLVDADGNTYSTAEAQDQASIVDGIPPASLRAHMRMRTWTDMSIR